MSAAAYACLADAVLLVHAAVVLFVVGGLAAVVAGHGRWPAVDHPAFRAAHAAAIAVVAAQAWLGQDCPLTTLESWLRVQAGTAPYASDGFVAHWVQRALFHEAPPWVFTLGYTAFGLAVAAAWWRWPPRRRRRGP